MAVIAVIFDFDDTLLPDSTSALLTEFGIDPTDFWSGRARQLVEQGFDPPLAYLNLLLDEVRPDGRLEGLTNDWLGEFGASLDETWFEGLPGLFEDVRAIAAEQRDVSVEFYIISGGLDPIIGGSEIVKTYFSGYYACQLGEDPETGVVRYIKRCVTFTEKTRFIFEINKGIRPEDSRTQPHLVNAAMDSANRRIPMRRMIYVGDGMTDIPCFSLVRGSGGVAFGVFKRGAESAKQAFQEFLQTDRVTSLHSPDYREDADLGSMIRAAVATTATRINLDQAHPL